MVKKIIAFSILLICVCALAGCTQQNIAKNWGGTYEIELPAGQDLELVTWFEDSTYGVFEGEIIIHEN